MTILREKKISILYNNFNNTKKEFFFFFFFFLFIFLFIASFASHFLVKNECCEPIILVNKYILKIH